MAKWGLRLVVIGFVTACGDAPRAPVTVREVACSIPAGVRENVKSALAAGELERGERRLTRARVSCATDAWVEETANAIRAAFVTSRSGDALAADAASAKGDAAEAARNRDRALRAYEREEHAVARAVASEAPASDVVQYSPHGAFVRLAGVVVDVREGRIVKRLAPDVEPTFAPNDTSVALVDAAELTVIDLATGAIAVHDTGKHDALVWSDDARYIAWTGNALTLADVTTGVVQSIAPGAFDTVQLGRGVVSGLGSDDRALVVHRIATGTRVARIPNVASWAIDRSRDRIVFFESTSRGTLHELDLVTAKTRTLAFRAPRYGGMCGEGAMWSIAGVDGDRLALMRDCSGVDEGSFDLKTQKVSLRTIADGEAIGTAQAKLAQIDKAHFEDVADVDFENGHLETSPDDQTFAGLDRSGRARVWSKAGKLIWAGPVRPEHVLAVASSGRGRVDGSELLTVSHAGELRRWDARSGTLLASHTFSECGLPVLAVRDDGEGIVLCSTDEKVRVYRESAAAAMVEHARDNSAELFVLDQRGAYVVFEPRIGKPLDVIALDATAKTTSRALPAPGSLVAAAGDIVLLRNLATDELAVWKWSTAAELVSVPATSPRQSYRWNDWATLAGRGRYLAAARLDHIGVWSLGATATQLMTLTPSPASPRAIALASDEGPVLVRGSIDLATWTSPHKSHTTPIMSDAASVDFSEALRLFVVARAMRTSLEDGVSDPAMELFAAPYSKNAVAINHVQNTVTFSGDVARASDLVACKIGKRTVPFAICAGRWVD